MTKNRFNFLHREKRKFNVKICLVCDEGGDDFRLSDFYLYAYLQSAIFICVFMPTIFISMPDIFISTTAV